MRIRKRQPLFPLPSFSPLPLSDPQLINPSPVVQLNDIPPHPLHLDHPQPSDYPLPPIGKPTKASDDSPGEAGLHEQLAKQYGLEQDGRGRAEKKDNDPRKGSILGSETVADLVLSPSSSSPSNQDGRWYEGEKAIPLKKRRGRLERIKVEEDEEEVETSQNSNKKAKTRMKTKMNKKCSRTQNDDDQDYEDEEDDDKDDEEEAGEEKKGEGNVGRKRGRGRGRGSTVMEGSRCSRVNGRGWRCCQQTLVGYSLCEHHLGKGRLRSITSVKTRSVPTNHIAPPPPSPPPLPSLFSRVSTSSSSPDHQKHTQFDHALGNKGEDHKEAAVIITKKRMKLGVVKARSISSLLGQTTTQVAVAPHNDNK